MNTVLLQMKIFLNGSLKHLKIKKVVFLRNHGALISGLSLEEAYMSTYMLNLACAFHLSIIDSKSTYNLIPVGKAESMKAYFYSGLYKKHFNGFLQQIAGSKLRIEKKDENQIYRMCSR
jgi:ribulose-5-phosphate 4-epimerase/fuculose-1-phosphate aldolase